MRLSQQCHIQSLKCRPSIEADQTEVEDAEIGEEVEADVAAPHNNNNNETKVPNTQIYQLESGQDAPCISGGVVLLIFVVNLHQVLGKTSSQQSQEKMKD